jgi:hypothetical protein
VLPEAGAVGERVAQRISDPSREVLKVCTAGGAAQHWMVRLMSQGSFYSPCSLAVS